MNTLPPQLRIAHTAAVLDGPYGSVTRHAQRAGLSRQALYRDAATVLQAVAGDEHRRQLQQLLDDNARLCIDRELLQQQAQQAVNVKDWMSRGAAEIGLVFRGAVVIYFQLVIVTAIATTLSLFLTPTVNFSVTAFIWIVGNLQWVVAALADRNDEGRQLFIIPWLARGFYYLLPHFHDFNIMGSIVHPEVEIAVNHNIYAATVSVYGVVYALMILLVGVLFFDKKEV